MNDFLNITIIIGVAIIILGITYCVAIFYIWKRRGKLTFPARIWLVIVLIVTSFMGAGIAQYGDQVRKMTFSEQEIKFIEENKPFSSFTKEDLSLYHKTNFTYELSTPEIYEKYYSQFLEWGIDAYLERNKHRTITRKAARSFVESNMKTKRNFYLENYCKTLCKLAMS